MRTLLLLILLAAAGAWFYPQVQDGADSPCAAMERRSAALVEQEVAKLPGAIAGDSSAGRFLAEARKTSQSGTGAAARSYVAKKFPELPPDLACTIGWWQIYLATDMRSPLRAMAPR